MGADDDRIMTLTRKRFIRVLSGRVYEFCLPRFGRVRFVTMLLRRHECVKLC